MVPKLFWVVFQALLQTIKFQISIYQYNILIGCTYKQACKMNPLYGMEIALTPLRKKAYFFSVCTKVGWARGCNEPDLI